MDVWLGAAPAVVVEPVEHARIARGRLRRIRSAATSPNIGTIGEIVGREVVVPPGHEQAGDVKRTGGTTELAASVLGWSPQIDLRAGLERQVERHRMEFAPLS